MNLITEANNPVLYAQLLKARHESVVKAAIMAHSLKERLATLQIALTEENRRIDLLKAEITRAKMNKDILNEIAASNALQKLTLFNDNHTPLYNNCSDIERTLTIFKRHIINYNNPDPCKDKNFLAYLKSGRFNCPSISLKIPEHLINNISPILNEDRACLSYYRFKKAIEEENKIQQINLLKEINDSATILSLMLGFLASVYTPLGIIIMMETIPIPTFTLLLWFLPILLLILVVLIAITLNVFCAHYDKPFENHLESQQPIVNPDTLNAIFKKGSSDEQAECSNKTPSSVFFERDKTMPSNPPLEIRTGLPR